ncbi:MAG: lipopolysaccharide heptosyltransferase II [Burkholderiales bacterium]
MKNATNRILIVAPSWVGDAVLSQPLLARIKAKQPDAQIDVLAPAWVLPMYRRMPEVADTLENPFNHGELALSRRAALGRDLRTRGYAAAYVLPNSLKSALVPFFARIPRRVGFVGELRYGLLTDARRLDKDSLPLMVERFAWLAENDAASPLPRPVESPALAVGGDEAAAVFSRLCASRPQRLACFCPGAEYGPAKRWPVEYFAGLAESLADEGYQVWLLGSRKDAAIGAQITDAGGAGVRNVCGETSLDDAIVLLSAADLVVTNDSGLMHVAAALRRPTVAIYGSSSPQFTPPLSATARVVKLDLPCSPCFRRVCPLGHFNCMMQLPPQRILQEVHHLTRAHD